MAFESLAERIQNTFKKLNSKGLLTEADVKVLADYIIAGQYIKNADLNNDGKLNATDIVLLVNNIKSAQ